MNMKTAQKLVSLLVVIICGLFLSANAEAAQLLNLKLTLGDSRPTTPATHTFTFTHPSNSTLGTITFEYCEAPSGTCDDPDTLITTTATKGVVTGLTNVNWTLDASNEAAPVLEHLGAGETVGAGLFITVPMENITNHAINECQPGGDTSTDTCYVWVNSKTPADAPVDTGIVSYTVVAATTVTARVDPSFTFVVESVDSNVVNSAITTSAASTFSTLPFGNLTAGTPKYVAQGLRVTTNTQNGYTITMKILPQSGAMLVGNYTTNNIDPFISVWGTPTTWTEPTGSTPNDNTGWIGANTTDVNVTGWGTPAQKFGPVSDTAVIVSQASASDNGSAAVYVTYAIEANVFQPADTYSGTLQYNALPTY